MELFQFCCAGWESEVGASLTKICWDFVDGTRGTSRRLFGCYVSCFITFDVYVAWDPAEGKDEISFGVSSEAQSVQEFV